MDKNKEINSDRDLNKIEDEDEKEQKYWNFFKENYKNIPAILGIIYTLAIGIKNVYSFFYALEAEKFYGIPHKYFYNNPIGDINVSILFLLALALILFSPTFITEILKKRILGRLEAIVYSLLINLVILTVLLNAVIQISYRLNMNLSNSKICGIPYEYIILLFILIITILSFYSFVMLFTKEKYNLENNDENLKSIKTGDENKKQDSPIVLYTIIVVIVLFAGFFLVTSKFNPSYIKSYEIILEESSDNTKEKNLNVVVGEYKDYMILMEAVVEDSNNPNDNKLVLKKYFYEFKGRKNTNIGFYMFKDVKSE